MRIYIDTKDKQTL